MWHNHRPKSNGFVREAVDTRVSIECQRLSFFSSIHGLTPNFNRTPSGVSVV
jgi:hypothetical protein